MNFEENNSEHISPPGIGEKVVIGRSRGHRGWKIVWAIITVLSVLANLVLILMLIGLIGMFTVGQRDGYVQKTVRPGPWSAKIAVINLCGIIDGEKSKQVREQISKARDDSSVKALIVRVNSPGGGVGASDRIYNLIRSWRSDTHKPAVAFMQGVAASGGYYSSVACDKIVAEPTTVTGSIGVIMTHLAIAELFEDKLGIQPTVVKAGAKKDWPSLFEKMTPEQEGYLQRRLISPAYNRFVELVAENRESLSLEEVIELADGSIYFAPHALEEKLIDQTGYFDAAIELAKSLAGVKEAQVVEYSPPFSLAKMLSSGSQSLVIPDKTKLYEMCQPQLMYLWRPY